MRVAQMSDIHYSPEFLTEVNRCFTFAVDEAIKQACHAAVISGDLFDHRVDLHSPAVAAVCEQVKRLADHMPVLILQGTFSHDVPGSLDVFRTIGGVYPVHVADEIGQVGLFLDVAANPIWGELKYLQGADIVDAGAGDLKAVFSCLPPVNKGAVAAHAGAHDAATAAGEYVYQVMRGWSVSHQAARARGIPAIVVSHGTVANCITEQGCPMHGNDWEFSTGALFSAEACAVMLGHIHQFQGWEKDGRRIAYPGSIGRLHFGELTDKGFLIWSIEADGCDYEFVKTPAKRLLQIEFDGPPDMAQLREAAATADGAHVRIRWSVDEAHRDSIDKAAIEALFGSAEAVKMEGRINPIQRQRAAGITQATSLADKLAKWCETTGNDPDPLLERLALLGALEPDQIADITPGVMADISNEKEQAA